MDYKQNNKNVVQNKLAKFQLKIMSWNIQSSNSILGNKFNDSSFINIFNGHNIICLQEIRQAVKLAGFRSLCNLRPGGKSGGVGILYKNEFLGGIEHVNNHNLRDVIICKLKK